MLKKYKIILKKLRILVLNFFYRWIKKPYQEHKNKLKLKEFDENVKNQFIKSFNVKPVDIINLMSRVESKKSYMKPTIKMGHDEYKEFLKNELKESAVKLNSHKPFILSSVLFEPKIVDEHNEFRNEEAPTINELISIDFKKDEFFLKKEKNKLYQKEKLPNKHEFNNVVKFSW